ncbi:hypothetical protein AVEN_182511-1 [Araneus ventricosus]|uniref:Uncharacterized protein n=1 Tax=Araneus ventricosus TaxID=182803 RepID=A0A4Y2BXZ4_ARAVE|nr:hypothetical protein AVEN_182511-1 [Araneus ventricosus]
MCIKTDEFPPDKLKAKPWPNNSEREQAKKNKSLLGLEGDKKKKRSITQLATRQTWTASSAARAITKLNGRKLWSSSSDDSLSCCAVNEF